MADYIKPPQFLEAQGTEDWRILSDGARAYFATSSFSESAALVAAIAGLEGVEDHRPAVDIRADGVTVRLATMEDSYFGMNGRDVAVAGRISKAA